MNKRESIKAKLWLQKAVKKELVSKEELEELFKRIDLKYPESLKSLRQIEIFVNVKIKNGKVHFCVNNCTTKEEVQYYKNRYEKTWNYRKENIEIFYQENATSEIDTQNRVSGIRAVVRNKNGTENIIVIDINVPISIKETFKIVDNFRFSFDNSTNIKIHSKIEKSKPSQ